MLAYILYFNYLKFIYFKYKKFKFKGPRKIREYLIENPHSLVFTRLEGREHPLAPAQTERSPSRRI